MQKLTLSRKAKLLLSPRNRGTLKSIADELSVSKAMVSAVLSGKRTSARVMDAINRRVEKVLAAQNKISGSTSPRKEGK